MLEGLGVLTVRELKKWLKTPFPALGLFVGPIVWVFIFGNALNSAFFSSGSSLSTLQGSPDYFNFLATGMAVNMTTTYSSRAGGSLFTDRFTGYLDRLLTSPASRATIIVSKILGGMILSLVQALVLLVMSIPLGLTVGGLSLVSAGLFVLTLVLLSSGFSAAFVILSLRTRRWQTQQLVGPLIVTPVTFLSTVFYPASRLPPILQGLVQLNPLSYAADMARALFFQPSAWLTVGFQTNLLALAAFVLAAFAVLTVSYKRWL
jgi:ABC-2 type transport system permease protein